MLVEEGVERGVPWVSVVQEPTVQEQPEEPVEQRQPTQVAVAVVAVRARSPGVPAGPVARGTSSFTSSPEQGTLLRSGA